MTVPTGGSVDDRTDAIELAEIPRLESGPQMGERVAGADRYNLHRWEGATAADLTAKMHATILDVQGRLCIGEQVKGAVAQTCGTSLVDEGTVPAPASATAVFQHALKAYGNAYLSVTLIALC